MLMQNPESQNPYQFIVEADHSKKRRGSSIGSTKKGRIMVVLGGVGVLLVAVLVVSAIISSASNAGKAELISAAQRQAELIRVSKIGLDRAKGSSAKNLATSVNIALLSDQSTMVTTLKGAGVKLAPKDLALGKNPKTDALLTNAEQSNKFDEVFVTTIQTELVAYQKSLKAAYDKTDSKKLQQSLSAQFNTAGLLATAKQ